MARETQKKVVAWCEKHYGGESAPDRLRDIFEEATELAAALNIVSLPELLDVVKKSWEKSQAQGEVGDLNVVPGEIGDIQIATAWLAADFKIDTQQALDEKMRTNRAKSTSQSRDRLARKNKIFGKA